VAERYSQANRSANNAPDWARQYLLQPGSGFGWQDAAGKRGVESQRIDPLGMLQSGSDQYGLTAWDDLFDDGGQITNGLDLLKAMNFGGVVGQEGSRGNPGDSGSMNWGDLPFGQDPFDPARGAGRNGMQGGHRPTSGDISYDPSNPMHQWLEEMSYEGKNRGRSWTGRNKRDIAGYWYDPANLRFGEEDLQGINTRDELDAWAQENYGLDAMSLGAMSQEMLDTNQQWRDDPSQWWQNGEFTDGVLDINGLDDATLNARLAGLYEQMDSMDANHAAEQETMASNRASQAALYNPHLMRTAQGGAMAEALPELMGQSDLLGQFNQPNPSFDYGLTSALAPYLQQLQLQQARYGGGY